MQEFPEIKTLTASDLRRFEGLELLDDETASQIIETLKLFAILTLRICERELKGKKEEQKALHHDTTERLSKVCQKKRSHRKKERHERRHLHPRIYQRAG